MSTAAAASCARRRRRRRSGRLAKGLVLLLSAVAARADADVDGGGDAVGGDDEGDPDVFEDCWGHCRGTGLFCEVFCCQPLDGIGNPTCWDLSGHYSYERCCVSEEVKAIVAPPEPDEPLLLRLGSVTLPLYRGPSDHNSPKINERTAEIALGLWYMRRCLAKLYSTGIGYVPIEVGNVLASYWPSEERLFDGRFVPWQIFDLGDNGVDATKANFANTTVLSISTVEHIGYDNMGTARVAGYHVGSDDEGLANWLRSWDEAAALLARIAREANEFLVTFPLGFNPHLDGAVARAPWLRRLARVVRRVDALNRWEQDPDARFDYRYDFRDMYDADHVGYIYDPRLPVVYEQVFGQAMLAPPMPLPFHPPFRFANAICVVTNVPELLA